MNLKDLNGAVENASVAASIKTAKQRMAAQGRDLSTEVLSYLNTHSVDVGLVTKLTQEINCSTDRNESIQRIILKGDKVGKELFEIVKQIAVIV